ncbi:MAG: exosortase A, partial [Gemmatimonadota bacterium]|nr:exosortase A [Gemmatimonadota bacterium]
MSPRMWVGVSLGAVLAALWPTLLSFHDVWTSYTYSHGYLVAGLSAWLLWRARARLWEGDAGRNLALPILLALGLLWLAATVMQLRVVHQGVLPLAVAAWALGVAGPPGFRAVLPATSLFLFAVPFWEVFIGPLQQLTILVSGNVVRLFGIQAEISGELVRIPSGTFEVAGTCAGLNFFIVGTFLGTAYAYLFLNRWRSRLAMVALAAATAVVANWVRVTGLVVIGHVTEMTHDLLQSHQTYGWVIFSVAFVLLFWLMRGLERRDRKRGQGDDLVRARPGPLPEEGVVRRRALLACGALLVGPLIYFVVGALPARAGASPAPEATEAMDPWRVAPSDARPFDWRPEFGGAGVEHAWVWTNGTVEIYHDRLVYPEQRQGAELIGGPNRIAEASAIAAERPTWLRDLDRTVREALIMTPEGPVLVWYWYRVGGVETVSPAWAKLLELWGFVRRRPVAELEALSVACGTDGCEEDAAALRELMEVG